MKLCSHEGCGRKIHARGMCQTHYGKWSRATSVKKSHNDGLAADVLKALPGTVPEIAAKVGCSVFTAGRWVRELHGTKTYICDWRPAKGPAVAVWAKGRKEDVPCTIQKKPRSQISREWRLRHIAKKAAQRASIPRPQSWFSALEVRA